MNPVRDSTGTTLTGVPKAPTCVLHPLEDQGLDWGGLSKGSTQICACNIDRIICLSSLVSHARTSGSRSLAKSVEEALGGRNLPAPRASTPSSAHGHKAARARRLRTATTVPAASGRAATQPPLFGSHCTSQVPENVASRSFPCPSAFLTSAVCR